MGVAVAVILEGWSGGGGVLVAWLVVYLAPDYTTILCVSCASLGLVCDASFRSGYVLVAILVL